MNQPGARMITFDIVVKSYLESLRWIVSIPISKVIELRVLPQYIESIKTILTRIELSSS